MHLLDFLMHHLLKMGFPRDLKVKSGLEVLGWTEMLGMDTFQNSINSASSCM